MKAAQALGVDGSVIPNHFLIKMQSLLGEEYQAFHKSLLEPSVSSLRMNPLKISHLEFQSRIQHDLIPVSWCPCGYSMPNESGQGRKISLGKHPYHAAGLYYLQEPSAMAPVEILNPQPGERVLDLAAAPGGKTTQIVSRMENTGLVVANEIHPQRVWDLAENLERWGVQNAIILNENPARLVDNFSGYFDRVLLDAPCSGEGMFRKSAAARSDWSPTLVNHCASRQTVLLDQAAHMLRPGGIMVYSTCTFAPEENEAVVARFLSHHPEFKLADSKLFPGFKPGRPDWVDQVPPAIASQLDKTLRLWPHHLTGDGHFIARFQHTGEPANERLFFNPKTQVSPEFLAVFQEFCASTLHQSLEFEPLWIRGSYLYQAIPGSPDLAGLRVIYPGRWLGVYKQSHKRGTVRFEPSHALALGLQPQQVQQSIALEPDAAVQYLRGEPISAQGGDGWVLVCVDAYPLGWGKRSAGMIKNLYPKGLRWL